MAHRPTTARVPTEEAARDSFSADRSALLVPALVTITLLVLGVLYVPRMIGLFPLEHDVTPSNSIGDDWLQYHQNALSVLHDGLSMPNVRGPYLRPAGFGYAYFIAMTYAIFGERSEAVYLLQGLLLVLAMIGLTAVLWSALSPLIASGALLALVVAMYADIYNAFSFRLLSENLVFPLLAVLLFCALKGESTGRRRYLAGAGAACGLCFLARPNLLLFGPAVALVLLFGSQRPRAWRVQATLVFVTAFVTVCLAIPLRDYVATGRPGMDIVTRQVDWTVPFATVRPDPASAFATGEHGLAKTWDLYWRRAAFIVGVPYFVEPRFRLRPHWLIIWGGFGFYLLQLLRRKPELWEKLVLALAFCYFAPLLQVGSISSYGVRMLSPGVPLVLVLAAKGLQVAVFQRNAG